MTEFSEQEKVARKLRQHLPQFNPGRGCVWFMGCVCGWDGPDLVDWTEHVAQMVTTGIPS